MSLDPEVHIPRSMIGDIVSTESNKEEKRYLVVGLIPKNTVKFQSKPEKGVSREAERDGVPFFAVVPGGRHKQVQFYALCLEQDRCFCRILLTVKISPCHHCAPLTTALSSCLPTVTLALLETLFRSRDCSLFLSEQ
jgi:hypothetical protein